MTTIVIEEDTLDISSSAHFSTVLDFVQSLDISELLDFRQEDISSLPQSNQDALSMLEKEGTDDCINI